MKRSHHRALWDGLVDFSVLGILSLQKVFSSSPTVRKPLIMFPVLEGSLGDDAMLAGAIHLLKQQGVSDIAVVSFFGRKKWSILGELNYKEVSTHSFSPRLGMLAAFLRFSLILRNYTEFYVIGADILDGHYSATGALVHLRSAKIATYAGLQTTLLGFSFNNEPAPECVKAFRKLSPKTRICVRDEFSRNRLQGFIGRPVTLVSDVAFSMQPQASDRIDNIEKWIICSRQAASFVVGINANRLFYKHVPEHSLEGLVRFFTLLIEGMIKFSPEIKFVFLPHDSRPAGDLPNDFGMAELIVKRLGAGFVEKYITLPKGVNASEVKYICGHLDAVFTQRMHVAVASLGQAVPVVGMTYQGKFAGLFQYFEQGAYVVEPGSEAVEKSIALFCKLLLEKEVAVAEIKLHLPTVLLMSASNVPSHDQP